MNLKNSKVINDDIKQTRRGGSQMQVVSRLLNIKQKADKNNKKTEKKIR